MRVKKCELRHIQELSLIKYIYFTINALFVCVIRPII